MLPLWAQSCRCDNRSEAEWPPYFIYPNRKSYYKMSSHSHLLLVRWLLSISRARVLTLGARGQVRKTSHSLTLAKWRETLPWAQGCLPKPALLSTVRGTTFTQWLYRCCVPAFGVFVFLVCTSPMNGWLGGLGSFQRHLPRTNSSSGSAFREVLQAGGSNGSIRSGLNGSMGPTGRWNYFGYTRIEMR